MSIIRGIGDIFRPATTRISALLAVQEPTSHVMSRSTRDVLYRVYVIVHILPTVLLTLPAVLPASIVPAACLKPLQWYLSNYNDPLVAKSTYPGGWFGGLSVCEVLLQLPYFLWATTLPIGSHGVEPELTIRG